MWNGTSWVNIQDTAIAAAAAAAVAAQSTADGKNKVYRQDAQPSGGTYVSGDIWFDTDDNNKIYRYSGSAWVAVQLGGNALANVNANSITAGTIDASVITVSNITASNISTGTLAAARIAANSLDVSVLQAGTLRAGTVYSGNIVASQITTGTMSADRISGGTITGALFNLSGTNSYGEFSITNTLRYGSPSLTWGPTATPSFEIYQFGGGDGTVINAGGTGGYGYMFINALTRIEIKAPEVFFDYTIKVPSAPSSAGAGGKGIRNIYSYTSLPSAASFVDGDIVVVY